MFCMAPAQVTCQLQHQLDAVRELCCRLGAAAEMSTEAAMTGTAWAAFLHLGTALLQHHCTPAPHTDPCFLLCFVLFFFRDIDHNDFSFSLFN